MASNDEAAAVWVSVDKLTPWEDNPRRNEAAVPEVMASIRRFGFATPIVARDANGEVIAGHTRLEAARRLGLDRVPVRFMDLDPADAHLLALADNKVGEIASWDDEALAGVLRELDADGALAGIEGLGFDQAEIDMVLDGAMAVGDGEWADALGGLPEGDRAPIQTMTFTLHDDQVEVVRAALSKAKGIGPFDETGNENSNGNALARVCEMWMGPHRG